MVAFLRKCQQSGGSSFATEGPTGWLLVLLADLLQNVDEALESEHVSAVRAVVDGLVIPETLEGAVCEVYHAHVHTQRLRLVLRGLALLRGVHTLRVLALVDDEQRAGVEAVRGLALQHTLQAAQFAQDGLKKVFAQLRPVVHELKECVSKALGGKAPAVVLVPA